ncbi:hypothetical protein ADUPG1_008408 [Aduncisulcus paluster]|uniref:Uncharacterized protein n=1 Tax=Aduncisulcus paluster TaxID=2918883 RepID=A0ABQ5KRW2_9EUKA|nr:hypothetical protein ADUPG1_008408 [Aduncisulcus paluster]
MSLEYSSVVRFPPFHKLKALLTAIEVSTHTSIFLYYEAIPQIKAIFDTILKLSPSAQCYHTHAAICFKICYYVLNTCTNDDYHTFFIKESGNINEELIQIVYSILPKIIQVEIILRDQKLEENATQRVENDEMDISIVKESLSETSCLTLRILNRAISWDPSLSRKYFPNLLSFIAHVFNMGQLTIFEDPIIEDILDLCRNIIFVQHDPTRDSFLSLLLPHILPWAQKYPDRKFFLLWIDILKNITLDKDNSLPHEERSSQLWFMFHPVLSMISDISPKNMPFIHEAISPCLCFFASLSSIPAQAEEVYDHTKDLLGGWFEVVKEKKDTDEDRLGIKYWCRLISYFSSVPSLIAHISPKFDADMEWCLENTYYISSSYYDDCVRYMCNCNPSLSKWGDLINSIMRKCLSATSTSRLYNEHNGDILSTFQKYQSKCEVIEHKTEIVLCCQCLRLFMHHVVSETKILLPVYDILKLIGMFIEHLSRLVVDLEGRLDEVYCLICCEYTHAVVEYPESFLLYSSQAFQSILKRRCTNIHMDNNRTVLLNLFEIFQNISCAKSLISKQFILNIFKDCIEEILLFMKKSDKSQYLIQRWILVLVNITSNEEYSPIKSLCAEVWPLFHSIYDVICVHDDHITADKFIEISSILHFFSHLCCDPLHAVEVYDTIKDRLNIWFESIKTAKDDIIQPIRQFSRFLSVLSSVPSLIPKISPRYDDAMKWCKDNGDIDNYYYIYLENCYPSLKKWICLISKIQRSQQTQTSKLYQSSRVKLLDVFTSVLAQKNIIHIHKQKLIVCCQCLSMFVMHKFPTGQIYEASDVKLSFSLLTGLVRTFIDHLSKANEKLEGAIDEEYCKICEISGHKEREFFYYGILPTLQNILERGSQRDRKLRGRTHYYLLKTLRNISKSSPKPILQIIKPYIIDWMELYPDSKSYGFWMEILTNCTWSHKNESANRTLCSEAWPLFHPILNIVKREFVGNQIDVDSHELFLFFFNNLCSNQNHIIEIYENVKHLLGGWFEMIKTSKRDWNIQYLSEFMARFISTLSSEPLIIPELSPKFDEDMKWCSLIRSIPMIATIPTIETSPRPDFDGHSFGLRVCSWLKYYRNSDRPSFEDVTYFDLISGKRMNYSTCKVIQSGEYCYEFSDDEKERKGESKDSRRVAYSPLLHYSLPQKLLVKMKFKEERPLRQAAYDLIEETSAGTEVLFDDSYGYPGYLK